MREIPIGIGALTYEDTFDEGYGFQERALCGCGWSYWLMPRNQFCKRVCPVCGKPRSTFKTASMKLKYKTVSRPVFFGLSSQDKRIPVAWIVADSEAAEIAKSYECEYCGRTECGCGAS